MSTQYWGHRYRAEIWALLWLFQFWNRSYDAWFMYENDMDWLNRNATGSYRKGAATLKNHGLLILFIRGDARVMRVEWFGCDCKNTVALFIFIGTWNSFNSFPKLFCGHVRFGECRWVGFRNHSTYPCCYCVCCLDFVTVHQFVSLSQ